MEFISGRTIAVGAYRKLHSLALFGTFGSTGLLLQQTTFWRTRYQLLDNDNKKVGRVIEVILFCVDVPAVRGLMVGALSILAHLVSKDAPKRSEA
jgi:hypothetical protein